MNQHQRQGEYTHNCGCKPQHYCITKYINSKIFTRINNLEAVVLGNVKQTTNKKQYVLTHNKYPSLTFKKICIYLLCGKKIKEKKPHTYLNPTLGKW